MLIDSLSEPERKDFVKFINSQRQLRQRKDLELFESLVVGNDEAKEKFRQQNADAYHSLRKRLAKRLGDFVVLKRMEGDITSSSSLMGILSLARYLFERRSDEIAWYYLNKAEQKAQKEEQFEILNAIYLLQIENSHSEFAGDLDEIISRKKKNQTLRDEDEKATIACNLIRRELQRLVLEGGDIDFEAITQEVLKEYALDKIMAKRPRMLYNILTISRSVILAKKDFYSFEPYIIQQYQQAKSEYGFAKSSHYYKLSIIYMIAHVLYRNRKFKQAEVYIEELGEGLLAYDASQQQQFHARYILLKAGLLCYRGKLDAAVELLQRELPGNASLFSITDQVRLKLNLAIYHFLQGDFSEAIKTAHHIGHSNQWCIKYLGKEWLFKKSLMEIIAQYQSGNVDIAINLIRSFERAFSTLFDHPLYDRTRSFLGLIKKLIDEPNSFYVEDTWQTIEETLTTVPEDQEDLQAMTFYAWIKAKYLKRDYYEVLLETVVP